ATDDGRIRLQFKPLDRLPEPLLSFRTPMLLQNNGVLDIARKRFAKPPPVVEGLHETGHRNHAPRPGEAVARGRGRARWLVRAQHHDAKRRTVNRAASYP